jgi:hypothetical protein
MVLDHGIERGLNLYKEKIIRPRWCRGEHWVSDEVRGSGIAGCLFGKFGKGRI